MVVWHDQKLGETLSMFRNERAHLAIVRDVENEGDVSCSRITLELPLSIHDVYHV
jgi:hypothetical protein